MNDPVSFIGSCHNVFIRQMHFIKENDSEVQHAHEFDHITLVATGSVEVVCNGQPTTFKAPHMVYIKANTKHGMRALEDDTVCYCIHAMSNSNKKYIDDIITPDMVPNGSVYDI